MSLEIGDDGSYNYCRTVHRHYRKAAKELAHGYKTAGSPDAPVAILTPSGNAAVGTALTAAIKMYKEPHLLCDTVMYNDSKRCIKELEKSFPNLTVLYADFSKPEETLPLIQSLVKKSVVLFCETCTNPAGVLLSAKVLQTLARTTNGWHVVLDNSFLSHVRLNPFITYGVDRNRVTVVSSCSKHLSAGACIAGVLLSYNKKLVGKAYSVYTFRGYHVCPETCQHIMDALPSLKHRCFSSSSLCMELVKRLQIKYTVEHDAVRQGCFNPYTMADVFNIRIPLAPGHGVTREAVHATVRRFPAVQLATSYGGKRTRICNYVDIGPTHYCLRISCGYDNTNEIGAWVRALKIGRVLDNIVEIVGSVSSETGEEQDEKRLEKTVEEHEKR